MAEQTQHYEMAAVESKDIMPERQAFWDGFMRGTTYAVAAVVAVLLLLLVFVA